MSPSASNDGITTPVPLSRATPDSAFAPFPGRIFRPHPGAPRPVRGRVVMVHGLNLAPVTMDPLAEWLANQGFAVARVALCGHRESFRDLMWVHHESWQADIENAVGALNKLDSEARSAPLCGVGFSLGGLLLAHHVRKRAAIQPTAESWSGLALLAPAFVPRLGGGFPLGIVPRWFPYFSFTPRVYRRWAFLPHNAYVAIAGLMRAHQDLAHAVQDNQTKTKCTVFVHPRDELVHAGRLIDPPFRNGFTSYEVHYLRDVHRRWTVPRHLICHPGVFKADAWTQLCNGIVRALLNDQASPPRISTQS